MTVELYGNDYLEKNKEEIKAFEKCLRNTVFQSFNWLEIAKKEMISNPLEKKTDIKFAVMKEGDRCIAIAPLIVRTGRKRNGICILGSNLSSDYLDFLFVDDITEEQIVYFVNEILSLCGRSELYIRGLPEKSITFKALSSQTGCNLLGKERCVSIPFDYADYDGYLSTLKKSVRQNIRTAANRMATDGKVGVLSIYKQNVDASLAKKIQKLYEARRKQQNAHKKSFLDFVYKTRRAISIALFNYMAYSMVNNPSSLIITYEIDGCIAAFGHALKNENGDLFFVQISIDDNFRRYSPGIMMLTEFMKESYKDTKRGRLDLTVGTEQYKYDLGGQDDYICNIIYRR